MCVSSKCNCMGVMKDSIYTITSIWNCSCGEIYFNVDSMPLTGWTGCKCPDCGEEENGGLMYLWSTFFAPIEYNSAHGELIKEIVIEKLDIPIKEPVL